MDFFRGIKSYVHNPLGIIGMFISLIYAIASLLLGLSANNLTQAERWPIIIFIVIFPILILLVFYLLVTKHHGKLYSPSDFRTDSSFLTTLSQDEIDQKVNNEVAELVAVETDVIRRSTNKIQPQNTQSLSDLRKEYVTIEDKVIKKIELELKIPARRNFKVGTSSASFDAIFYADEYLTALEVKIMRNPHIFPPSIDSILYNAVLANNYLESGFRLIIIVVYLFDRENLKSIENLWKNRIERCPVAIDLRFIANDELSDQ